MSQSRESRRERIATDPEGGARDAERAVLGACLLGKPDLVTEYRRALPGEPGALFADPLHARIWRAICTLTDNGQDPDQITVPRQILAAGDPLRPADRLYIHELYELAPMSANLSHVTIVRDHALARRVVEGGTRIIQIGQSVDPAAIQEVIARVRVELDELGPVAGGESDSWAPVDLGPALAGGDVTAAPAILARTDGVMLLYPGRVHSLAGEPESGKTWAALAAVVECIQGGQHVLYLDFEDTPEGIAGRCLAIGASPEELAARLHYIRPDRPIDAAARAGLADLIAANFTTLAVVDGVTEAMTLHGYELEGNTEAARFYEALPRFLTHLPMPPAVLLIDHVIKDEERRGRYAIGAQHKLAGLDGVAYMVDVKSPFAPGQAGHAVIWVAKDRNAMVVRHAQRQGRRRVIAELWVDGDTESVKVELRPPRDPSGAAGEPTESWRPTGLMERISRYLEVHPGLSLRNLTDPIKGKNDHKRTAVRCLLDEGFLRIEKGPRNASLHYSELPFRERPDEPESFDGIDDDA